MKFNVPSKTFYNAASAVIKVINPKSPMTILANFLLTLKENELTISGSDIENSVSAHIPVTDTEGNGGVCVDAKRLVELLKEIPDQGIDWTFYRENTEGEYALGSQGINVTDDMAFDFKVITSQGCDRIARAAFDFADKNGKTRVTAVTKANTRLKAAPEAYTAKTDFIDKSELSTKTLDKSTIKP